MVDDVFEVESLSAPSRYVRTTWMLSAQTDLELPGSILIRRFGEDEARSLAESIRRRNVFSRHSRENNFYLQRVAQLAGHTIIEVSLPGDPRDMAEEASEIADLVEKVTVLSTTVAGTKSDLQRGLGISAKHRSSVDFAHDPQYRFLRSRLRAAPAVRGIQIDQRFRKRILTCGFHRLVQLRSLHSNLSKRMLTSLDWLFESRLEPQLEASVVRTAIALESLLIFDKSESLARSLSERAAFILSPLPDRRREISRIVKRFYDARSRVVHGSRKKAKHLTPSLVESVDRLSMLLYLVIGTNQELWPSDSALRDWCENQRWGKPATDVQIPFGRAYMNNAIALGKKG